MFEKILSHPKFLLVDPDFITGITRQQAAWGYLSLQLRQPSEH